MAIRRRWLLGALLVIVVGVSGALTRANRSTADDVEVVSGRPRVERSLFVDQHEPPTFGGTAPLVSQLCTEEQFRSPAFARWLGELKQEFRFVCTDWEYAYILQAIAERGLMVPGRRGLGFGVGQELIPSILAKHGVDVLATDLDVAEATRLGWVQGQQHMSSLQVLNARGIATEEQLRAHVTVRNVDMNGIPEDLRGFDFTWSKCALGHLGNVQRGLEFVERSLATLKAGGIAVHTTELNLSSNTHTLEGENTSVLRRRDVEELAERLRAQGHEVIVNLHPGTGLLDYTVDEQFGTDLHVRLRLTRYAVGSFGLIIRKNPNAAN